MLFVWSENHNADVKVWKNEKSFKKCYKGNYKEREAIMQQPEKETTFFEQLQFKISKD